MATNPKAALDGSNPANDAAEAPKGKRGKKAKLTLVSAPTVASSLVEQVSIGLIERAPENVRKTAPAAAVAELADDIAAHGLLQSLIGYWDEDAGRAMICGGGRRLQALFKLRDDQRLEADYSVPVLLRSRAEAIELSLAENLQRQDMNPADEFDAFALLLSTGTWSPADVAKRFGFTERHIKQRLRLAQLAPEILEALREGVIGIDVATEFAKTDDTAIQSKVFQARLRGEAYYRWHIHHIRSALASEGLTEDSAVFQFIDRKTYEKEGGGYVEDLFLDLGDGDGRKLNNGTLARTIATRCLEFQAGRLITAAKTDFPTVVGHVVSPSLLLRGDGVQAPKGYVAISGGWNSNLSKHVDIEECWERAKEVGALITLLVGITQQARSPDDDDDAPLKWVSDYSRSRFFVPKDMASKVWPEKTPDRVYVQKTPEERATENREREIRKIAAQLAIKANQLAGVDGRRFWGHSSYHLDEMTHPDLGAGFYLSQRVFVTPEEVEAQLEAATVEYDRELAEQEAARAAKEAEAAAVAEAKAARVAQLLALDPAPAVVVVDDRFDDGLIPYYRHPDGSYLSIPVDGDEDDGNGMLYEDLAELVADMGDVVAHYTSLADYLASETVNDPEASDGE
ncbi:MAG TPA: ParB/RepB/Spo0J family partition protein [Pseudolabrys sp.]|nr:ParB/RepB/Spo0J family partition protein [Pseudolabrys sp.]